LIAVDTSALIAILFDEPEAEAFIALIGAHDRALVGAPTALEFRMVALRQANSAEDAAAMLGEPPFEIVPFGEAHGAAALRAFTRFGRGRHPAQLNFGDCMAYAVAEVAGCPLLFKGDDFSRTDIKPAV